MTKLQDVHFKWDDGGETTESFSCQQDVFDYMDAIKEDTGVGVVDFNTDPPNGDWAF